MKERFFPSFFFCSILYISRLKSRKLGHLRISEIGLLPCTAIQFNLLIQHRFSVLFSSSREDRKASSSGKLIEFDVLEEIRAWLARGLAIGKRFNGILVGESGTGKSTLLQQLEQRCQNQKPYVYCHRINCKHLIGKLFSYLSTTT